MSPLPKKVEKAGTKGLVKKRKPYKVAPEDFFNDANTIRNLFGQLINTKESERIVLVPSVSYGMANIAEHVKDKKGEILILEEQFPSNVYPWLNIQNDNLKVRFVQRPNSGNVGKEWNRSLLDQINENTVLVSTGHIHWTDGTLFDLEAIREKTNSVDALMVIDGTQSIGALPFDLSVIKADAVVCAGYKWLFGPYGMSIAYYGAAFDNGSPIEQSWSNRLGAQNFGGLINYTDQYQEGAIRYEMGESSNFILLPMVIEALKLVLKWGPENIQQYCRDLTEPLIEEIKSLGFNIEEGSSRTHHLFGIYPPKHIAMESIQSSLKKNKVSVSTRGSSIRIAPNVYNDQKDMRRLIKSLKEAVAKSPSVA